ncbi:MAG: ribonuclease H family protein [Bacteroidales bacterium]|nr:ribonuclease H family protein [Bacteroidales bacterium]MDY6348106.1 ribonuclease H family protein [Bacteroidales bacterium]
MAKKQKYYVVWEGRVQGVFDEWKECERQVAGFAGARYKSFETRAEADRAFLMGCKEYYRQNPVAKSEPVQADLFAGDAPKPILRSLSVDAAWNSVTKVMEYRGVYTETRQEWFHRGPFKKATNNVGEFLAIVHGLSLLKKHNIDIPIYTDSMTALSWVRKKRHNSVILPTAENENVINLLENAVKWLENNTYSTKIYKWNTPLWGEIPADFGRK